MRQRASTCYYLISRCGLNFVVDTYWIGQSVIVDCKVEINASASVVHLSYSLKKKEYNNKIWNPSNKIGLQLTHKLDIEFRLFWTLPWEFSLRSVLDSTLYPTVPMSRKIPIWHNSQGLDLSNKQLRMLTCSLFGHSLLRPVSHYEWKKMFYYHSNFNSISNHCLTRIASLLCKFCFRDWWRLLCCLQTTK